MMDRKPNKRPGPVGLLLARVRRAINPKPQRGTWSRATPVGFFGPR